MSNIRGQKRRVCALFFVWASSIASLSSADFQFSGLNLQPATPDEPGLIYLSRPARLWPPPAFLALALTQIEPHQP